MEISDELLEMEMMLHKSFSHISWYKPNPKFMKEHNTNLIKLYLNTTNVAFRYTSAIKKEFNSALRHYSISYNHWVVMKTIFFNEANSPSKIAKIIGIDLPSVTRLSDSLESLGFVERRRGAQDRRTVSLYLTDSGESVVNEGLNVFLNVRESLATSLAADELELLTFIENNFESSNLNVNSCPNL